MKILFLTSNLSKIGGIQKYIRNLLRALQENKENILVIELEGSNIKGKLSFLSRAIRQLFKFKPDIVFCSHINFSPLSYFFKKIFDKNYIILTYGIDVWDLKGNLKFKALKEAKIIVTISNFTKDKIIQKFPELQDKIFMLPNSIDGGEFKPKKKSLNLLQKYNLTDEKVILTITRLLKSEGYKGYDKVIGALSKIIKEIPKLKYLLVGAGDDVPRIKKLINGLNLNNYVIMPGFIPNDELVDYYNLADVFVMPSKKEGFGFVFIEALACGKPVIAGSRDGSVDALLDGELGILVNPDNINEIAEATIKVLKKQAPSHLLDSEYLRKRVLEVYGFDKFKERVKNLLYVLSR